jgi:hypothetical protein
VTARSPREAVENARSVSSYPPGMCQQYVRLICWQVPSLYGSAIEAWNGARDKHPGDRTPPLGAPLYYRGGKYGHAVIFVGGDDMRSTDCRTRGRVSDEAISWVERNWGYVYLGWTGDLNGVELPLRADNDSPEEEDEMTPKDWEKLQTMLDETVEKVWAEKLKVTKPGTGDDVDMKASQIIRETWQKVTKAT